MLPSKWGWGKQKWSILLTKKMGRNKGSLTNYGSPGSGWETGPVTHPHKEPPVGENVVCWGSSPFRCPRCVAICVLLVGALESVKRHQYEWKVTLNAAYSFVVRTASMTTQLSFSVTKKYSIPTTMGVLGSGVHRMNVQQQEQHQTSHLGCTCGD